MSYSITLIYTASLPKYSVANEPDFKFLGKVVDTQLNEWFGGQKVIIRGISSADHPDLSHDELIAKIIGLGTDRYDPERIGDRYENIHRRHIDFFGFRRTIRPDMSLFSAMIWGFYHGSISVHGEPKRIDILLIYDANKVKAVLHQYEGREDKKRDGFVFNEPGRKADALIGLVKVLA